MAKPKELFEFNLIPPPTEEELTEAQKKINQIINMALIPGAALLLSLLAFATHQFAVVPTRQGWENSNEIIQAELVDQTSELGQIKIVNGELKVKTDLIMEPVSKNVDFEEIFGVVEEVYGAYTRSKPTSYGREDDGEFIIFGVTTKEDDPADILSDFKNDDRVIAANLQYVQYFEEEDRYNFVIGFYLKNSIDEESGTTTTTDPSVNDVNNSGSDGV